MKQVVLDSSYISRWLKNMLKVFPSKELHEKGTSALRWLLFEALTLGAPKIKSYKNQHGFNLEGGLHTSMDPKKIFSVLMK